MEGINRAHPPILGQGWSVAQMKSGLCMVRASYAIILSIDTLGTFLPSLPISSAYATCIPYLPYKQHLHLSIPVCYGSFSMPRWSIVPHSASTHLPTEVPAHLHLRHASLPSVRRFCSALVGIRFYRPSSTWSLVLWGREGREKANRAGHIGRSRNDVGEALEADTTRHSCFHSRESCPHLFLDSWTV